MGLLPKELFLLQQEDAERLLLLVERSLPERLVREQKLEVRSEEQVVVSARPAALQLRERQVLLIRLQELYQTRLSA